MGSKEDLTTQPDSKIDDCSKKDYLVGNPQNYPLISTQNVGRGPATNFVYSPVHGLISLGLQNGMVETYIIRHENEENANYEEKSNQLYKVGKLTVSKAIKRVVEDEDMDETQA